MTYSVIDIFVSYVAKNITEYLEEIYYKSKKDLTRLCKKFKEYMYKGFD